MIFPLCGRNEEGEEQLRVRRLQLPFGFATGEATLYDVLPTVSAPDPCSAPKQQKLESYSVDPNSLLGCLLNQDKSLYSPNNGTSSNLGFLDDVAFSDTHATLSVPSNVWQESAPKSNGSGGRMSPVDTVQDMMETLQQILGEDELVDALDVAPEELKSWESKLLSMSGCGDMGVGGSGSSDNLGDLLSSDIFAFVEEQLRQEGELELNDQPLTSDDLGSITMQITSNQQPFCAPSIDSCTQNQSRTLRNNSSSSYFGAFPKPATANQQKLPPPQNSVCSLSGQSFDFAFGHQGAQWNLGLVAGAGSYGFEQSCTGLKSHNSDPQGLTSEQQQQEQQQEQVCFQRSLTSTFQNKTPNYERFRTIQAPVMAFPLQQEVLPTATDTNSSCMFANSTPPRLNQVHIPSKPSCFYQSLPGMAMLSNPEEALPLSCNVSLHPEQQQYLDVSQLNTQVSTTGCQSVHRHEKLQWTGFIIWFSSFVVPVYMHLKICNYII